MKLTENQLFERVINEVHESSNVTVALNENCEYIAVNSVACNYLGIEASTLLGKSALDLYPEITASLIQDTYTYFRIIMYLLPGLTTIRAKNIIEFCA